jgi:hypothetical protein
MHDGAADYETDEPAQCIKCHIAAFSAKPETPL